MFLFIFIHSNKLFQTTTQSFYTALAHINIRMRNKISAVITIDTRNIYPHGRACHEFLKFFEKKSHSAENCRTVPKIQNFIH